MDQKYRMPTLKIKIKCLSSWDANAGPPLRIRLPSQGPRPCWLAVNLLDCSFFLKSWRNVSLTCLIFFVLTGNKTALKTLLLQSSLSELPGKQAYRLVLSLAQIKLLSILIADSYIHYFCQQDPLPGNMKWSEVAELCSTLCDPTDCSLQGSSVRGIFQARVLAWVAISFSRGSSQPRDRTWVSCTEYTHW